MTGYELVDAEIRELIIELNARGFATTLSCAGHCNSGKVRKVSRGWIVFADCYDQEKIVAILKEHSLTGVKTGLDVACSSASCQSKQTLLATFDPIGQPHELHDLDDGEIYDALDNDPWKGYNFEEGGKDIARKGAIERAMSGV